MTLPSAFNISFSAINTELGRSATATINLNDTQVRQLAGFLSGTIKMSNLLAKTWATSFSTSVLGGQINVYSRALDNGWNTYGPVTCTIDSNSYSNSTGTPTILITGSFPNGLTLVISNGIYVAGKGGAGGTGGGGTGTNGTAGSAGGTAISVTGYSGGPLTFINNGFIGGGGGGGGGGGYGTQVTKSGTAYYPGGGGGGGAALGQGGAGGVTAQGTATAGGNGFIVTGAGGGAGIAPGSAGGNSGALGSSGSAGSGGAVAGAGGASGAATTGTIAAGVIWSVLGTRYGSVG